MAHSNQPISQLRQRMIDDMTMRRLNPKTQSAYIRAVKKLAQFLGHPPVSGEFPIQAAIGNSNSPRQCVSHRYLLRSVTLLPVVSIGVPPLRPE